MRELRARTTRQEYRGRKHGANCSGGEGEKEGEKAAAGGEEDKEGEKAAAGGEEFKEGKKAAAGGEEEEEESQKVV